MNQSVNESGGTGPSHRNVEIGVGLFLAALALIGIIGSLQAGIGWAAEGPRAGFFPFYVSLLVLISCVINLTHTFFERDGKVFADWGQLRQVVAVVVPTAIYVAIIPYLGIYVSSAVLIAAFMRWLGKYSWPMVALITILVPLATFFMFELWFLVPLPKGPLESFLGY